MQFTSVRFLQLTDEDLRGLGAVAARWAIVEYQTHALLSYLVGSGHPVAMNLPPEEVISFERKTRNIKKLLRAVCATYPQHLAIGLALITSAKELSNERKIIAHWIASRTNTFEAAPIQFAKLQLPPAKHSVEHSHWTTAELFDLADHLADWCMDLNRFNLALIIDGPLASQTTWHGPKPPDRFLDPDTYQTIGKNRRISTRGKRLRQP